MSDIATVWRGTFGDYVQAGADLQSGNDLVTALIISVMTDRVLPVGVTVTDGSGDPRGWWGDDPVYPIGSRIWTLMRTTQTQATLDAARSYLVECTQWLLDDQVVASFDITTEWDAEGPGEVPFLAAEMIAHRADGTTQVVNFAWAWADIQGT